MAPFSLKSCLALPWALLAYARVPGNAFSFWIRSHFSWSRGIPALPHEKKDHLFAYLSEKKRAEGAADPGGKRIARAETRAALLRDKYGLSPLARKSTQALYRKNLYLLDLLEKATADLDFLPGKADGQAREALDIGPQDWHYVFALQAWLRRIFQTPQPALTGIEIDAYERYSGLYTRRDYAHAYMSQAGNPRLVYKVGDFLKMAGGSFDLMTLFFPLVTRHETLLWGLPLRHYAPARMLSQAARLLCKGGCLMVLHHNPREHELFMDMAHQSGFYDLLRQGPAQSDLVAFHDKVSHRFFSIWKRK